MNKKFFGTSEGHSLIKYYGGANPEFKSVESIVNKLRFKNVEGKKK